MTFSCRRFPGAARHPTAVRHPTYRDRVRTTTVPSLPSSSGWLLRQELSSRGVVATAATLLVASAVVSVQVGDTLGSFFGLCFVLVCLTVALGACNEALFTAAVLPPLALLAIVSCVTVLAPDAVAGDTVGSAANVATRSVAGVVDLAAALILGHTATLVLVAVRMGTQLREN
jgi:hypothetical protein